MYTQLLKGKNKEVGHPNTWMATFSCEVLNTIRSRNLYYQSYGLGYNEVVAYIHRPRESQ